MQEFKLIVAGGRDFNDYEHLSRVLTVMNAPEELYGDKNVSIVSGMARGADALAVRFAKEHNIVLYEFPADWSKGKGAGLVRNRDMAYFSNGLLAFWDGKSKGTKHMIDTMNHLNKPVTIIKY